MTRFSGVPSVNPWEGDFVTTWCKGGQKLGTIRSESIIAKIKEVRQTGDKETEQRHWDALQSLGLFALEALFDELKDGDGTALAPIKKILINEIKAGKIKENAPVSDLLDWWQRNKDEYKLTSGEKDFFTQKTIAELTMPVLWTKELLEERRQ